MGELRDYQTDMVLAWNEKQLQQHVILLAGVFGWRHFHVYDSRRSPAGFPDLVLVHPGQKRLLFRELKTERGRLRPGQPEWLEDLTPAGQSAEVWRPRDVVSGVVERTLRGKSL